MANQPKKPPTSSPWDRCPWPSQGDHNQERLYAGIGRALSEWERYDTTLSFLFAAFVSPAAPLGARRAYSAVRTFEGRVEMLRAASEAHFSAHPDNERQEDWKTILRDSNKYAERRNEIAHGAVEHYVPQPPALKTVGGVAGYALFPSFSTFRNRDLVGDPAYCYASPELEYFRARFYLLRKPALDLSIAVTRSSRQRASLEKLQRLFAEAPNPSPGDASRK